MNQDELAKERARRPANDGTKRVGAADALAHLDQRITQSRNEYNGTADDAVKELSRHPTGSAPGVYRVPPSGHSQLSDMEKDLESKKAVPCGSAIKPQPGAYSVTQENASTGPSTLHQLEADVASKTRAAASAPSPSSVRSLSQMEADVQSKQHARPSRTGLSELETDVAAKSVDRSRPSDLEDTEAKFRASGQFAPAVSQGARRELDQMEAVVAKKATDRDSVSYSNMARPGVTQMGADEVSRLDERIAYKTGISMQQEELKEENPDNAKDPVNVKLTNANAVYEDNADAARLAKLKQSLESAKYENSMGNEMNMDGFGADDNGNKLAIAEAVKDDDDDIFIPAAIEYDPDAKPPIYKNRRFRLYAFLGGILLLGLVAGLAFGLLSGSDKDTAVMSDEDGPTSPPTTYRESLGIQDQLELVVGSDKLNDPSTPHYQAMEWVIHEDKLQLAADNPNLVQRFLMVLFYMQTTQGGDWRSCGRDDSADSFCLYQKLVSIFPHEYAGIPWIRWLSDESECHWAGVLCDEFDTVRAIDLYAQNMTGTMPSDLSLLPYLQSLTLSWNSFTGTIPSEFAEMKHLLQLEIHWNQLTGTLPSTYYDSSTLNQLNIGGNAITGSLPPDKITGLSEIKGLFIDENLLNGTLPTEIGQLSLLSYARFQRNFFTGNLPSEFGNLDQTAELWFHRTNLVGTIPEEIASMTNLRDFRIQQTGMSGSIPEGMYNITVLERLDFYSTKMSGTISTKIGQLRTLDVFKISDCEFTGTIPTEMGLMMGLKTVWFAGNNFIGQIPDEICSLRGGGGGNSLIALTADCLPTPSEGVVEITCETGCCTSCCESETGVCN